MSKLFENSIKRESGFRNKNSEFSTIQKSEIKHGEMGGWLQDELNLESLEYIIEINGNNMDNESNNNIVIFPSSWIDPISVQNPFTTMNNYEELYKTSPFNSSMKSLCVPYKTENTPPINIGEHSFISTQLDIVNKN